MTRCSRCDGCVIAVDACDTTDGPWSGWRCLNCGACFDPVMKAHRRCRPEPYGIPIIAGHIPARRLVPD